MRRVEQQNKVDSLLFIMLKQNSFEFICEKINHEDEISEIGNYTEEDLNNKRIHCLIKFTSVSASFLSGHLEVGTGIQGRTVGFSGLVHFPLLHLQHFFLEGGRRVGTG
jgi:hypothetical protein